MARELSMLAGEAQLQPLWRAVHERFCRGGVTDASVITLRDATPEVRRAVDRLLGRVTSAGQLRVQLGALGRALAMAGTDPTSVTIAACGPIVDRSAIRAAATAAAKAAWITIFNHPAGAEEPLARWLQRLRGQGRLSRAGGVTALLGALDVLAVVPVSGPPVGRQVLAAAILGGEHNLDDDSTVGRLVTAGLAARIDAPPPTDAIGRAALWATAGVSLDAVSTPALTLGLRPLPAGPLTEGAARWADGGVPLPVPAAAMSAERWRLPAGQLVSVCENPSVLEATAAKLGSKAPTLVCVSGMPGRAVNTLLTGLSDGGARIRYHGDFGAGGITIANLIVNRHSAQPWRMAAEDHRRAVERLRGQTRPPTPLRGRVPPASWDQDLAESITACGFEVTEEHVLDDLLDDLTAID